jgi:hypothetical protein
MPYTIEFYFETAFEQMLLDVWGKLAEAGVPSYYQSVGVRPHLTLVVLEQCNEDRLCPIVQDFSRSLPALTVTFVGVGLISHTLCDVHLQPIVTKELLDIHAMLYEELCASGNPPVDLYTPGHWMPRGSMSKKLSFTNALRTVEICSTHTRFGTAGIAELCFAEFNSRRNILTCPMRESS